MTLRRGFALAAGEPVVVVEDVITTGGSTREVIDAVRARGRARAGGGQPGRPQRRDGRPRRAAARACSRSRSPTYAAGRLPALRAGLAAREARLARRALSGAACRSTASRSPTTAPTSRAGRRQAAARRPHRAGRRSRTALARLAGGRARRAWRAPGAPTPASTRSGRWPSFELAARARAGGAAARAQRAAADGRARARRGARAPPASTPRKSAVSKLYRYVLDTGGRPAAARGARFAGHVPWTLDAAAVQGRGGALRRAATTSRRSPRRGGSVDDHGAHASRAPRPRSTRRHARLRGRGRRLPAQDGAQHGGRPDRGRPRRRERRRPARRRSPPATAAPGRAPAEARGLTLVRVDYPPESGRS